MMADGILGAALMSAWKDEEPMVAPGQSEKTTICFHLGLWLKDLWPSQSFSHSMWIRLEIMRAITIVIQSHVSFY